MFENRFPELLRLLNELEFDYLDGEGIDFEPFNNFLSTEEADHWLRSWTGNQSANAENYKVFGQDGSGGLAAIWTVRPHKSLLEQPIFDSFGSSRPDVKLLAGCR